MAETTKQLSREEQLVKLKDRVHLSVELLRRLPEEKLADYFNRSNAGPFAPPAVSAGFACICTVAFGLFLAIPAVPVWALVMNGGFALLNGALAWAGYDALKTNEKISEDIQEDIANRLDAADRAAGSPPISPGVR